jgi:hypothetical protein
MAVLIVGAAATAVSLSLLTIGADSQRSGLISLQSKQARSLATACGQEALQQIHDNIAYTGTGNLALGQGTCSYTVASTGANTRTVTTSASVGSVTRKLQVYVTIGSSNISITSWQEIS